MAVYDYICKKSCGVFSVETPMSEKKESYPCPQCGVETDRRAYQPILHKWNITMPEQARGLVKHEEDLKKQYKLANDVADNAYKFRSEMGTKKWVESGGKDRLMQDLAEQNFKDNKKTIISTPVKTTASSE